ncbi:MAG: MarR family transcriptional regulator [Thermodesulfobacteriota bacterium]
MKTNPLEEISLSALHLFPLLKRLFNGDPGDPALAPLRNQTYHILRILERKGPMPVSAIGKQLIIAKQNMTTLVDKLMKEGLVERKLDVKDRRVVNVLITKKGVKFLQESMAGLKKIVSLNLSGLGAEEIEELNKAFKTIRTIAHKLA